MPAAQRTAASPKQSSRAPKQKAIFEPSPDDRDEKPQKKECEKHATPTFDTHVGTSLLVSADIYWKSAHLSSYFSLPLPRARTTRTPSVSARHTVPKARREEDGRAET